MSRQSSENADQWKGRLRIALAECNYKEMDRCLKDHFIYGLNDNEMLIEIMYELTDIKDMNVVSSEQVLAWVRQVEAQRLHTVILDNLREAKDFDAIRSGSVEQRTKPVAKASELTKKICGYCGSCHLHWPVFSIQEGVWDLWENKLLHGGVQEKQ